MQKVIHKAWEDEAFKHDLIANPKVAIEMATGTKIPESIKIVVNDQSDASKSFINIPPKPDYDNMELTDEQLEQVAGGEIAISVIVSVTMSISAITVAAQQGIKKGW
ncbi:MAG: class IIb bacteriocin, lactobin A/cerein 7B family [Bacteroidota bacterium]